MVAASDIKAGELILTEESLIHVPIWSNETLCLKCCQPTKVVCRTCKMIPICKKCVPHDPEECTFFRRSRLSTSFVIKHQEVMAPWCFKNPYKPDINWKYSLFQAMTLLRCLALYSKDPKLYDKLYKMESHNSKRKDNLTWQLDENTIIIPLLRQTAFIENSPLHVTKELLHHFCGVFDINAFEVRANLSHPVSTQSKHKFWFCLYTMYPQKMASICQII